MASQLPSFHRVLVDYEKARMAADSRIDEARDSAIADVDAALEALLATPSPSPNALAEKLRVLEQEYGIDAQPRHLAALYADARAIA
jgi:hypothetical protein